MNQPIIIVPLKKICQCNINSKGKKISKVAKVSIIQSKYLQ